MIEYLTIGRIAKQAGVNLQTVFYYERRGMLSPTKRTESGYRLYTPESVRVIRFIKNAQALGFTLDEVARLLKLRVSRKSQCGAIRRQAETRLTIVQEKISSLRAMEKILGRLIRTCAARGTTASCPILESLEDRRQPK